MVLRCSIMKICMTIIRSSLDRRLIRLLQLRTITVKFWTMGKFWITDNYSTPPPALNSTELKQGAPTSRHWLDNCWQRWSSLPSTHRHSIYNVVGVWVGWTSVVGQLRLAGSRQSHIYVLQPAASFEAINRWRGFECLCSIATCVLACLWSAAASLLPCFLACRIFQTDIGRNASGYLATTGTPIENGFSIQEAASFNLIALVSAHNPGFGFVIFPNCRFLFTQITNPAKTVHQGKGFGNGLASQFWSVAALLVVFLPSNPKPTLWDSSRTSQNKPPFLKHGDP